MKTLIAVCLIAFGLVGCGDGGGSRERMSDTFRSLDKRAP